MRAKLLNNEGRDRNKVPQMTFPNDREGEVQYDRPETDEVAPRRGAHHLRRTAWVWVFLGSFAIWGLVIYVVFSALFNL